MSLSEAQQAKRQEVIAMGGSWMSPEEYKAAKRASKEANGGIRKKYDTSKNKSSYSSKSLPYDKRNITQNSQSQVTKFRKGYKEVSPDAQMIVDQIIDPAMQNSTVLLPTYGVGSVYTATNILAANYDANGESIVATYPSLKESIYYTSGSNIVTTLTGDTGSHVPYMKQRCSIRRGATLLPFVQAFNVEGNRAVLSKPSVAAGTFLYAFRPAVSPNNDINIRATLADNHNTGNLTFTLSKWDANEVLLGTVTAPFTSGSAIITMFGATLGIEWISIGISTTASTVPFDSDVTVEIYAVGANNTLNIPNVYTSCLIANINGSDTIISSAESYFISSQSTLLTYEGSSLKDNGRLAIARVPSSSVPGQSGGQALVPTASSYYQWLASLSRNSYNGPTKHGGYAFYLGEDEQNYFYRPVEDVSNPELPYVIGFFSTDPTDNQAVRIQVTSIVQFTTNSNIYNQSPSPYIGEDWCKILHILSSINAAYDNSGHRAKLSAALKKVGGKVMGLLKDPKTYLTIAKIAGALGAL